MLQVFQEWVDLCCLVHETEREVQQLGAEDLKNWTSGITTSNRFSALAEKELIDKLRKALMVTREIYATSSIVAKLVCHRVLIR